MGVLHTEESNPATPFYFQPKYGGQARGTPYQQRRGIYM